MTDLVLDEVGMKNNSNELSVCLTKEAEVLLGSLSPRTRRAEPERIFSKGDKPKLIDLVMRRFIWWCLGCPIRGKS